jgi:DNA end-binding protein Ku
MPRSLWNGAITFGLVHIPVALYPASQESSIDFDWLDKRSMDPVGYKRVNKRTGREIDKAQIVRGIRHEQGEYVVLSDDEIRAAYPKTTQTIEIESFVDAREIPFVHLERPYYLAPIARGQKVYALLREALRDAGRVGIARVVIQTRQHLAALIPVGPALLLETLRWADEVRPWDALKLPAEGTKAAGLAERELKMARELIDDMSASWDAARYHDTYREAVAALVNEKLHAGDVQTVEPLESAPEGGAPSNVVDLTALLRRSLKEPPRAGHARSKAAPATRRRRAA